MTRQKCKEKLEQIQKIADSNNLIPAVIFFPNAITGDIQCRYIYADEHVECSLWLDSVIQNFPESYRNPKRTYAGYIDGLLNCGEGSLFDKE